MPCAGHCGPSNRRPLVALQRDTEGAESWRATLAVALVAYGRAFTPRAAALRPSPSYLIPSGTLPPVAAFRLSGDTPYDILSDSDLADATRKLDIATEAAQSGGSRMPEAASGSR